MRPCVLGARKKTPDGAMSIAQSLQVQASSLRSCHLQLDVVVKKYAYCAARYTRAEARRGEARAPRATLAAEECRRDRTRCADLDPTLVGAGAALLPRSCPLHSDIAHVGAHLRGPAREGERPARRGGQRGASPGPGPAQATARAVFEMRALRRASARAEGLPAGLRKREREKTTSKDS